MRRKSVLLDLRDIKTPSHGFGQIAKNYARHFSQLHLEDFTLVTIPETEQQEYQYLIGQETTLSWSTKLPVIMILETVTESGTRVWQGEKRFEVGKTEYDEVMV